METFLVWLAFWRHLEDSYEHFLAEIVHPSKAIAPLTVDVAPTAAPMALSVTKNQYMINQEKLYREAKVCLGYPQKMDPSVPNMVACASSLSGVLTKAGFVGLPAMGIAGTGELNMFLKTSPQFEEVAIPAAGDVIMSPSNSPGALLQHGHVGIVGNNGIMSNDSDTGLWREAWTVPNWYAYYQTYGKLPVLFYRWVGDSAS